MQRKDTAVKNKQQAQHKMINVLVAKAYWGNNWYSTPGGREVVVVLHAQDPDTCLDVTIT